MRRAPPWPAGQGQDPATGPASWSAGEAGGFRARGPSMAAWVTSERDDSMADGARSARGRFHGKRAGASNLHGRWWGRGELQACGRASSEHGSCLRGRRPPGRRLDPATLIRTRLGCPRIIPTFHGTIIVQNKIGTNLNSQDQFHF
jgi:hypothetical protein